MTNKDSRYDVVVIGSGVAGLTAAVSAQEHGARVCIVERAREEEAGGNTRWTGAYLRMKSIEQISDDFEDHLIANGGGYLEPTLMAEATRDPADWPPTLRALSFVDPNVVACLANEATPTLKWLCDYGLQFFPLEVPFPTAAQPRMVPSGGGLAIVEALMKKFVERGGAVLYETKAESLLQDEEGAVCGVRAIAAGNKVRKVLGHSVVIASGGFQGNAEMLTRYLGPRALNLRGISLGCHFNKGEGIQMALDIGAAPCGDFGSYHASPMDPRSNRPGPSMYMYPYGILVNKEGQRFVDEGPGETDETYERVTRRIFAQTDGLAYCILDAKFADVPNQQSAVRTEQPPIEASTIRELAAKLEIQADILEKTVADYNAACVPGTYDPRRVDGLATRGVTPPKSNWARPLDQGPFKAYPIISSIVFTFGGLKTDSMARVVNTQGDPIPGLYAAGEAQGLYYHNYTGATSVLKGAVFGRIAGQDAASRSKAG